MKFFCLSFLLNRFSKLALLQPIETVNSVNDEKFEVSVPNINIGANCARGTITSAFLSCCSVSSRN